jgi:CheY-like chemotaxis protein
MTESTLTVLLAEDDENDVLFIRRALRRLGTAPDLIVVDGGEVLLEYLRLARTDVPDLLLLDHRMPGLNGIEVLFWLRTERRWRDLPVLFLSNALSPNDQQIVCGLRAAYALKTTLLSDLAPALVEGIRSAFALVDRPGRGRTSPAGLWPLRPGSSVLMSSPGAGR